ncbi:DVU_1553 family AMP-dependent CoA ligase [Alicyclobacillus sp. SO9]|uniref:DVU_1553 family AMP-dependent CoA ligase n=1 Tax=Alicyclobacillus sp. SO9 TaxID=2665646 RepID=UPI0018E71B22|nr:AMP-binding protein [Alicyclobacillus sp. SO9]QQE80593.1 phenylacetate--CoA ligase family protein [Alicyclobacillus sp. SO9]
MIQSRKQDLARTPMEAWIHKKITGAASTSVLTRNKLEDYQLQMLRKTVSLARAKSPFYKEKLAQYPAEGLSSIQDISQLPFTTAAELKENPLRFLCCSQDDIERIVTLESSGTTGTPKRIFFTRDDQELTRDFFHHALGVVARPGDTVLVMLPGERPGSVGDLFAQSALRMDVRPVPYGLVRDPADALRVMQREQVDTLLGIPVQVLALASYESPGQNTFAASVKNVIVNTDSVPRSVIRRIQDKWGCRVFNHYAMTEMGLGGGLECAGLDGYHMREADLLFEIVNPVSGQVLPDGSEGEVVFTTLTRRGMPLIRYRTGDISRFMTDSCSCGSVLKRLAPVRNRAAGRIELISGDLLSMSMLDEVVLAIPGVLNFKAVLTTAKLPLNRPVDCLSVTVQVADWVESDTAEVVEHALFSLPVVAKNVHDRALKVNPVVVDKSRKLWNPVKRVIQDERVKERA